MAFHVDNSKVVGNRRNWSEVDRFIHSDLLGQQQGSRVQSLGKFSAHAGHDFSQHMQIFITAICLSFIVCIPQGLIVRAVEH